MCPEEGPEKEEERSTRVKEKSERQEVQAGAERMDTTDLEKDWSVKTKQG